VAGPDKADCGWGVLGGPWATVHGRDVALGRQSRFLLALLLQRPGRPVPVDRIAASAGGSRDRAVAAARMAMSRLRTQLGAEALDGYVDTTAAGYVIDVDPLAVDHVAFEQRIREADAIEWPDAALRRLESALALWRGEPFGDFGDDEPFDADARTLAELHRRAVDGWGELALRAGRHREALSRLEAAALDEPLRERRWASLVLAHYRSGNQTQALREYERARQVLRDQVGLEPGVELRQLAARILDQDPDLDWRPARQRARAEAHRPLTKPSVLLGRDREVNDVLPGCVKTEGEPCARKFIETFGKRAFRRPLTADEVERFVALWRIGKQKLLIQKLLLIYWIYSEN
jgi:DNA-binding SARP family transcriptional activator